MALRQVRIGSLPDVFQYDDGDYGSAIETDHYIKSTQAPTAGEDMLRLGDIGGVVGDVSAGANITDHAIVRGDGGAKGVQDSLPTIDDLGNIIFPGAQTIDGVDPSIHAADAAAHHAKYTDAEARASINDIFGADGKADADIDLDAQVLKQGGTQVVGAQQAAEADLAAVPDLTGADTIDQSGLETYLGDIRTTLNNLLAKLRTHGLIDT